MAQRLTFRDKATDVAWQKQLRDKYLDEGAPSANLDLSAAVVRPISYHQAKQIIFKYEWLGTMASTSHHYGLFFGMYCAGVCCVSAPLNGAGVYVPKEWGLTPDKMAYLARGANVHWSPHGANSKLVAWTCKLVYKQTNTKLIIAYSDTDAGEIGTIYQACNWVCVGRGDSTRQWIAPNGRVYDQKYPYDLMVRQGNIKPRSHYVNMLYKAGWHEQDSNPKYRYVYVLDKSDKRLIDLVESKRTPYPKRQIEPASD